MTEHSVAWKKTTTWFADHDDGDANEKPDTFDALAVLSLSPGAETDLNVLRAEPADDAHNVVETKAQIPRVWPDTIQH